MSTSIRQLLTAGDMAREFAVSYAEVARIIAEHKILPVQTGPKMYNESAVEIVQAVLDDRTSTAPKGAKGEKWHR
jgi:hypothetical protein